jgi:hypothetical protein
MSSPSRTGRHARRRSYRRLVPTWPRSTRLAGHGRPLSGRRLHCATNAALGAANKAARDKPTSRTGRDAGRQHARSFGQARHHRDVQHATELAVSRDVRTVRQRCLGRSPTGQLATSPPSRTGRDAGRRRAGTSVATSTPSKFSGPRTLPVSADARIAHHCCLGRSQQAARDEPTISNRQGRGTSTTPAPTFADDPGHRRGIRRCPDACGLRRSAAGGCADSPRTLSWAQPTRRSRRRSSPDSGWTPGAGMLHAWATRRTPRRTACHGRHGLWRRPDCAATAALGRSQQGSSLRPHQSGLRMDAVRRYARHRRSWSWAPSRRTDRPDAHGLRTTPDGATTSCLGRSQQGSLRRRSSVKSGSTPHPADSSKPRTLLAGKNGLSGTKLPDLRAHSSESARPT